MKKIISIAAIFAMMFGGAAHAQTLPLYSGGLFPSMSSAVEASHVIKAKPGILNYINVVTPAGAYYVMLFDATTVPADGTVAPKACFVVGAAAVSDTVFEFEMGMRFLNGIVVVLSSTGCFTKTASTNATFTWIAQ